MKKTILLLVLLLIPISFSESFSESLLDDVLIIFPTNFIAGSSEYINVSFLNTQSESLSFYLDVVITSSNVPPLNNGEITVADCDETAAGHFICRQTAQSGFNSFNYILTTLPNLYPGEYTFSGFLAMENGDQDQSTKYVYKYRYRQSLVNETSHDGMVVKEIIKEIIKEVPADCELIDGVPTQVDSGRNWLLIIIVGFCSLLVGILGSLLFLHYKNKHKLKDELPENVPKHLYTALSQL